MAESGNWRLGGRLRHGASRPDMSHIDSRRFLNRDKRLSLQSLGVPLILVVVILGFCSANVPGLWARSTWSRHVRDILLSVAPDVAGPLDPPEGQPRAQAWQGLLLLKQGRPDLVLQQMSSLAPGARQRPIDTWVLGQAYQQAGQLRQAVAIWQSQAARPLLVSTGWQAMEAQEFEVAVQAFRAACETDPVNTALPLALAHIGMGKALYQNGYGAEAALQETENAVTILPTEISGYLAMGDLLREEKRYVEANGWYRRAADLFPGDSRPWTRWGESAIRQQNYALATQVLEQAAGKLPNSAAVFYTLANAYFDAGDFARAEAAANKAVALAPDESAWYWIVTGRIHEKFDRSDKALAAYRRALQIDPNNLVARDGSTRLAAQP